MSLLDTTTFGAQTTITLTCNGFQVDDRDHNILAIEAGAVH